MKALFTLTPQKLFNIILLAFIVCCVLIVLFANVKNLQAMKKMIFGYIGLFAVLFVCMAGESVIVSVIDQNRPLNENLGVAYTLKVINDNDVILTNQKDTIFMSVENTGIFTDTNKTIFIK